MGEKLDVVVVGAGRVGMRTTSILHDHGHSVTVVERDTEACEALSREYVATVIEGDATRPSVLRQADPDEADVVAALTGNTGTNFGILNLALRMADDDVRTVMRTDDPGGGEFEDIVDEVVYPEGLGGLVAANAIIGADVRAIEDITGELEILEIRVAEDAPIADRTLADVSFPRGSLVISDTASGTISGPETTLSAGETFIVATEPAVADEVTQLFRG